MREKLSTIVEELAAGFYEDDYNWAFEGGCVSSFESSGSREVQMNRDYRPRAKELVRRVLAAEDDLPQPTTEPA